MVPVWIIFLDAIMCVVVFLILLRPKGTPKDFNTQTYTFIQDIYTINF